MIFPIPQLNISWNGGPKKDDAKSDVSKSESPFQFTYAVDPVMLLMVTALVLFIRRDARVRGAVVKVRLCD